MFLGWVRARLVARETAALRRATAIAATAPPYLDPLQLILEAALPVIPGEHLVLLRAWIDRMETVVLAATGTGHAPRGQRASIRPGSTVARALETGETQLVTEDGRSKRSMLVVPVVVNGAAIGVLESAREGRAFTARHATLLRAFADQCAAAIQNTTTGRREGFGS